MFDVITIFIHSHPLYIYVVNYITRIQIHQHHRSLFSGRRGYGAFGLPFGRKIEAAMCSGGALASLLGPERRV